MNDEQKALLDDYSHETDSEKRISFYGLLLTAGLVSEVQRDEKQNVKGFGLVPEAEEYLRTLREGSGQEMRR